MLSGTPKERAHSRDFVWVKGTCGVRDLDQLQIGALSNASTSQHSPTLLGACLQAPKSLLDVLRLDRRLPFRRRIKQSLRRLPLLGLVAACLLEQVFVLLDLERFLSQGLHHLESQEAQDVDDVVRGLAVGDVVEAGPLPETLALAVGEGGLAELGPGDVLLLGHAAGALVGLAQPLEGDEVHLLLLLVFLVLALRHLLGEERGWLPGQADLALLVLLGCVVGRPSDDRVFAGAEVSVTALVVAVLDVLADVLPGQEGSEARDLGCVVADLEDQIVNGNGPRATTSSQLRATTQL